MTIPPPVPTPDTSFSGMYDFRVLRQLRKREGMSIAEVSRQSGVSPAVISKLERNQTVAELETLFRLARVFGMTATDLLSLTENRISHKKLAGQRKSGAFQFSEIQYDNVRCLYGQATKGGEVSRPEIHHDDYEVCWVLLGEIVLTLPEQTYELKSGEAVQFDAILHHTYKALEDSKLIILHLRKAKRF